MLLRSLINKIKAYISAHTPSVPPAATTYTSASENQAQEWLQNPTPTWAAMRDKTRHAPTETTHANVTEAALATEKTKEATTDKKEEVIKSSDPFHQEKLQALERLRALPRGINVDGRSAAILSLLEDNSFLFAAVRVMRWPEVITCPRCHSSRIKRRPIPPGSTLVDQWYYTCLHCEELGTPSDFDDMTNIALSQTVETIRQWMACYYLIAFCSPSQLSKILGVSAEMLTQLMFISKDVEAKQQQEAKLKKEQEEAHLQKKKRQTKATT